MDNFWNTYIIVLYYVLCSVLFIEAIYLIFFGTQKIIGIITIIISILSIISIIIIQNILKNKIHHKKQQLITIILFIIVLIVFIIVTFLIIMQLISPQVNNNTDQINQSTPPRTQQQNEPLIVQNVQNQPQTSTQLIRRQQNQPQIVSNQNKPPTSTQLIKQEQNKPQIVPNQNVQTEPNLQQKQTIPMKIEQQPQQESQQIPKNEPLIPQQQPQQQIPKNEPLIPQVPQVPQIIQQQQAPPQTDQNIKKIGVITVSKKQIVIKFWNVCGLFLVENNKIKQDEMWNHLAETIQNMNNNDYTAFLDTFCKLATKFSKAPITECINLKPISDFYSNKRVIIKKPNNLSTFEQFVVSTYMANLTMRWRGIYQDEYTIFRGSLYKILSELEKKATESVIDQYESNWIVEHLKNILNVSRRVAETDKKYTVIDGSKFFRKILNMYSENMLNTGENINELMKQYMLYFYNEKYLTAETN